MTALNQPAGDVHAVRDDAIPTHAVWSLKEAAPDLWAQVCALSPTLAAEVSRLSHALPAQRAPGPVVGGAYVRPPRHYRALYRDLTHTAPAGVGCVGIKGTEVVADDLDALMRAMAQWTSVFRTSIAHPWAHDTPLDITLASVLERYALWERKVPGGVLLCEARDDANAAMAAQAQHLKRYGELARLPVPLFVHRHDDAVTERVLAALRPHLTAGANDAVKRARDGLGVLVYWYPAVPLRAAHIEAPQVGPDVTVWQRLKVLQTFGDPRATTQSWIALVARLLCMGFVATDPSAVARGTCVQAQNLVLDGGIVDLDSLRPMASFARYAELRHATTRTIAVLAHAIAVYLFGAGIHSRPGGLPDHTHAVYADVVAHCRQEADAGAWVPMPVRQLITQRPAFDLLIEHFAEFQDLST